MPPKPRLTRSGLLAESYGRRPYTVTLREEKEPGANVVLDYTDAAGRRLKPSLGYAVRMKAGRSRWSWDWEALERARGAAEDRSAELRLGQLRKETEPLRLTVGQAFALYHDEDRGGLPPSMTAIYRHRFARREWERWLGKDTPWNSVQPADVKALLQRFKDRGMAPSARELLKNLRACYNWLRKMRGMRHLSDPTEPIEMKWVMAGHVPRRPRYTPDQAAAIVRVRDEVDPRFALMVALMDDSGARREALRLTMRSDIDAPLDLPPGELDAPYGWILLPALKGQDRPLVFLTAFQRRELTRALTGYLGELERIYQEEGTDFPLFPAARVRGTATGVIHPAPVKDEEGRWRPGQHRAYQPISRARSREWLIEAEKRAGVEHVDGRGWHGLRRAVSDYLEEATDLATLTTAMGWSSQSVPEQIYLEKKRMSKRSRAREAMEKKRRGDA